MKYAFSFALLTLGFHAHAQSQTTCPEGFEYDFVKEQCAAKTYLDDADKGFYIINGNDHSVRVDVSYGNPLRTDISDPRDVLGLAVWLKTNFNASFVRLAPVEFAAFSGNQLVNVNFYIENGEGKISGVCNRLLYTESPKSVVFKNTDGKFISSGCVFYKDGKEDKAIQPFVNSTQSTFTAEK